MNIKKALLKDKNKATSLYCAKFYQNTILDAAAKVLSNGEKIIQFYEKTASDKENIDTAHKLRQLCSMYNALFIINSRPDIAQIVNADGICLFDGDMTIKQAKEILHDDKIFALEINTLENALEGMKFNADYICITPETKKVLNDNLSVLNNIKIIKLDRQFL